MGKYMVTGGAGLIGSHIVDLLAQERAGDIIVYDNFDRGRLENLARARARGPVTVVEGDIRDRARVAEVMRGVDVVFHQAAIRITQCAKEPRLALEVLADGTFNILEAAQQAGVKRVIAASSASAYGAADDFPILESHHPYNNRTLYGAAKVFNEGMLRAFHDMYGLDYVALRYFNVYGPRMDTYGAYTEVFIRWMERITQGLPPIIFGDGLQTMDFVYVEDIARANLLAATSAVTDEVFNIASGTEITLRDVAHMLLRIMGSVLAPEFGPQRTLNTVPRRLADVSKAKRLLGFEALVPFEEGLRRLVRWWREEKRQA